MVCHEFMAVRLVDITTGQYAKVVPTRKGDADPNENSHKQVVGTAFVMVYGFPMLSIMVGSTFGNTVGGASCLPLSGLAPTMTLRVYEVAKGEDI